MRFRSRSLALVIASLFLTPAAVLAGQADAPRTSKLSRTPTWRICSVR